MKVLVQENNHQSFLEAILAGIMIALGGSIYLSVENKILGSFLFALGLYTICVFAFNLFTGKVGYLMDAIKKKKHASYLKFLGIVWLGNLIGANIVAFLLKNTRLAKTSITSLGLIEKATILVQTKLIDSPLSLFILSIFCGLLMYIAVDIYKEKEEGLGRYLGIFLCVMVFILAGFEHCVANMFYFALAGAFKNFSTWYLLLVMTMGNSLGAMLIPYLHKKR